MAAGFSDASLAWTDGDLDFRKEKSWMDWLDGRIGHRLIGLGWGWLGWYYMSYTPSVGIFW